MTWKTILVSYNPTSKLAEKTLCDDIGQPLIGAHEVVFLELHAKLLFEEVEPILVTLSSNLISNFELTSDGSLIKTFAPLKFIELKGQKDSTLSVQLDKDIIYTFCGTSNVKFWLQSVSAKKRHSVELNVRMAYRQK